MSAPIIVQVAEARHAFGERRVLNGVDLDLRAGEIYCLLGVNGAGKTTLMRAICGRLKLDGGRVTCLGRNVYDDAAARAHIAFVPQNIALYPYLTVSENLSVFGRMAGVPGAALAREVAAAMDGAGLTARAQQRTSTLSGGYQRRVNICASILQKPAALVLDEPTVGIDVEARDAVHVILAGLKARGTAMLLTTHDLEQAQAISDRVGILHAGRIVMEGAPADLLRDAMGDRKEVTAILARAPDGPQAQALSRLGFEPTQSPVEWTAQVTPEVLAAGWLGTRIGQAGVTVRELSVRDPDLGSLFRRIAGRKAATP
jgi:ABC-2 type transport system ATP-binding protein